MIVDSKSSWLPSVAASSTEAAAEALLTSFKRTFETSAQLASPSSANIYRNSSQTATPDDEARSYKAQLGWPGTGYC